MHKYKSFDPIEHAKHDLVGKATLVDFLDQRGWRDIRQNDDESAKNGACDHWDIEALSSKKNRLVRFDAERRNNWRYGSRPFPFSTIHVPARKLKDSYSSCDFFFTISYDREGIGIVSKKVLQAAPVVEMKVRNRSEPDYFAEILIADAKFYRKVTGKWVKV